MSNITIDKNSEAFKNHTYIININKQISENLWALAITLKINRDKKYYRLLDYDTWESYLATPEISLSRSFVFKLIKNYEIWVEKYNVSQEKLQDIDSEKLYLVGTIADENNYKELLEKAKTLSRSDLNAEIKETKGISENLSSTKSEDKITIGITCPHCGKKFDYLVKE